MQSPVTQGHGRPLRVVAFAYSCEPGEGSEPGAGWIMTRALARCAEVWVITRVKNRPAIEPVLETVPERARIHVEYVDLPRWSNFWKRGSRGIRTYYLLWQLAALRRARRLHRTIGFDLSWHLTMSNVWLGSCAALLGLPFIYGPVGGGPGAPWRLWRALGLRGLAFEVARSTARNLARLANPLARVAWRRARLILAQNPETVSWLPARHRAKAVIFQHVVMDHEPPGAARPLGSPPTALFAARLVAWKGGVLALEAVARAPAWHLLVCGEGPEAARLRRVARRLGVEDRVEFLGQVPRAELHALMRRRADVLLFPSLHDDASLATGEAVRCGLGVICVDRGGPRIVAGPAAVVVSSAGSTREVCERLGRALSSYDPAALDIAGRARALELQPSAARLEALLKAAFGVRGGLAVPAQEAVS